MFQIHTNGDTLTVDDVFIRNYTLPEPAFESVSVEELQMDFDDRLPLDNAVNQALNATLQVRAVNYEYNTNFNITFWNYNNSNETIIATNNDILNNTITNTTWSGLSLGVEYCWFVQANNTTVGVDQNSSIYCFTTVLGVAIYEENNPTQLVTADVNITVYNLTEAWSQTAIGGQINWTTRDITYGVGLISYIPRSPINLASDGFLGIDRFYLLSNQTAAYSVDFHIVDYTGGDFSIPEAMIIIERWISGEEYYMVGGYRGATNSVGGTMQAQAVYNAAVIRDGETRALGQYYATSSGVVYLTVGTVLYSVSFDEELYPITWNTSTDTTIDANGNITDAWILVTYNNSQNTTQWVNITISEYGNETNIYYSTNVTTNASNISVTYRPPLDDVYEGRRFVVSLTHAYNPEETEHRTVDFYLAVIDIMTVPLIGERAIWQWGSVFFLIIFTAMIFSRGYSDVGCWVLTLIGTALVFTGFYPQNTVTIGACILAFIISAIASIQIKRERGEGV